MSEFDPSLRRGMEIGAGLAAAAVLMSPAVASANENSIDIEKQALAAFDNGHTRTIDSFPAPGPASLATSQVIEAPAVASTFSETLVPGSKGLISAEASSGSTEQECLKAATVMPELITFKVSKAGTPSQFIKSRARVTQEMPLICHEDYQRQIGFKFQYKKANKWISLRPYWQIIHSRNTASNNVIAFDYPSGHAETDSYYLPCGDKGKLPMRGLYQNKLVRTSGGREIIGKKTKIIPRKFMKVKPANC